MRKDKQSKARKIRHAESKALRRGYKKFKHLKPDLINGLYVLDHNGRQYVNADKKALLEDIATVENG